VALAAVNAAGRDLFRGVHTSVRAGANCTAIWNLTLAVVAKPWGVASGCNFFETSAR
jgi:hypothetical protein